VLSLGWCSRFFTAMDGFGSPHSSLYVIPAHCRRSDTQANQVVPVVPVEVVEVVVVQQSYQRSLDDPTRASATAW
jgi:hypothetical protein